MKFKTILIFCIGLLFPLLTFSQLKSVKFEEGVLGANDNEIIVGDWVTQFKVPSYPSDQWTVFTVYSSFSSSGKLVTTTIGTRYSKSFNGTPLKTELPPERVTNSYRYTSKKEDYGELFIYNKYGLITEKGEVIVDSANQYRYRATHSSSSDVRNYPVLTYNRGKSKYFKDGQKEKNNEEIIRQSNKIAKQAGAAFCCGGTGILVCADCSGHGRRMVSVQKSKSVWNPYTNQYEYKLVYEDETQHCNVCNGSGRVSCPTPTRCKEGKTGF